MSYSKNKDITGLNKHTSPGVLIIGIDKDLNKYYVHSSNEMKANDKDKVSEKIDYINSLERSELRKYLREKNILQTGAVTQTDIMNLYSLNLPVSLKIGFDLNDKIRLFGKLGGYGGLNISGKIQSEVLNSGVIQSDIVNNLNIGNDTAQDDLKPIDFGAQVGLGVQFKSFLIEVMYEKGLANLAANQVLDDVMQNKNLKFSIGYQFGN